MADSFVVEFDHRNPDGPLLVGPFLSDASARRWVRKQHLWDAEWRVRGLAEPTALAADLVPQTGGGPDAHDA